MAINPSTQYVGKIDVTDPNYPYGKSQNITTPSDGTGTPWESALINDLFGFQQALLDDAGIVPSGTPDNIATSQYLEAVKAAALKGEYIPPVGANISISGYLDRQGIWADDETGIQDANDYIVASGKRDVIKLPPGVSIPLTSALLLDVSYATLEGNGSEIDASGMASGVAINVVGSVAPPHPQNLNALRNLILTGPGSGSSVVGYYFNNTWPSGAGPNRITLAGLHTRGFSTGELYGGNASLVLAYGCDVRDCGRGLLLAADSKIITRFGGTLYGNITAVEVTNTDAALQLFGTSVEDNDKIIAITAGNAAFNGCRIGADNYTATPITIAGAGTSVDISGGEIVRTDGAAPTFDHWVDAGADTFFRSRGTRMVNINTATGDFALGDGVVMVRDAQYPVDWGGLAHEGCHALHRDRSMLVDGGFEEATINDNVFITKDSVAINDRYTGTSVDVAISNLYATVGGGQSLEYTRSGSAGAGASAFALAAIPVSPFNRVDGRLFYRSPAPVAGDSITLRYLFVKIEAQSNGVPLIRHREEVDSALVNFATSADTGWVGLTLSAAPNKIDLVAPEWATHFVLEVDGLDYDGSPIYFDDLNVNILG